MSPLGTTSEPTAISSSHRSPAPSDHWFNCEQTLSRHRLGDAAVELSVALEALLGDNQTSEMTHKVMVRAVRLLGGDVGQRKRNFAMFKKAYGIRSGLVHRGEEPKEEVKIGEEKMSAHSLIAVVSSGCADLICRIIASGNIPDWTEFDYTERPEIPA
nr:HEPN domain-containing protein [Cupriavidus necator]